MSYAAELIQDYAERRARLMGYTRRIAPTPVEAPAPAPAPEPVVVLEQAPEPRQRDVIYVGFDPLHPPPLAKGEAIIREVMKKHQVTKAEFMSRRRDRRLVLARQEAAWRMTRETTLSLPQIGRKLGGRDHTTVLHSIRVYAAKLVGEDYHKPRKAMEATGQ